MSKLKKKNLYLEINDQNFLLAIGEHDDELNFKILEHELYSPAGLKNRKIINLANTVEESKKTVKKLKINPAFFLLKLTLL